MQWPGNCEFYPAWETVVPVTSGEFLAPFSCVPLSDRRVEVRRSYWRGTRRASVCPLPWLRALTLLVYPEMLPVMPTQNFRVSYRSAIAKSFSQLTGRASIGELNLLLVHCGLLPFSPLLAFVAALLANESCGPLF